MRLPQGALVGGGPVRSGDIVVSVRDAVVGFPPAPGSGEGTPILRVPRLEARRGDRVGIVGPNGAGKTTLLRTVAGELFPLDGVVRIGHGVQLGYLAQLRLAAFPGETVLDALLDRVDLGSGEARGYLARFLFRGDDVLKPVAELSGGERSRLELALLGISPANLLLLDEPTNHLDIPAREALEGFLRESPATLLIVSHDRRLLESTCGSLWAVQAGEGGTPGSAVPFDGGWREWRAAVAGGWTVAGALEAEAHRYDPRAGAGRQAQAPKPAMGRAVPATGRAVPATGRAVPAGSRGTAPDRQTVAERGPTVGGLAHSPDRASRRAPGQRDGGRLPPLSKDAYRRQKDVVDADLTRLGLRKSHIELALADPVVQANFVELRRLTSELVDVDRALSAAEDAWLALEERAPR